MLLSRRQILKHASLLSLGGLVRLGAARRGPHPRRSGARAGRRSSLTDGTLQAVADTLIPGRPGDATDLGNEIHPKAIAGVHGEPGAVETDALLLFHSPLIGFDQLAPAFLAELSTRSLLRGGQFLDLSFTKRVSVVVDGLARVESDADRVGGGDRGGVRLVRARRGAARTRRSTPRRATRSWASRAPRRTGTPTTRTARSSHASSLPTATCRRREAMPERVDVLIVGSGFGGSISAYRLAELYRAAGQTPSILVMERGRRHEHTDFRQSHDLDNLGAIFNLVQGQGAQVLLGDGVGGGSNVYLAASLRAPSETFERRDRRPDDPGHADACGRARSAARRSTRTTRAPRRRCASSARRGSRSRSPAGCGPRRSTSPATAATAFRSRST